jgi:hypothetical protein
MSEEVQEAVLVQVVRTPGATAAEVGQALDPPLTRGRALAVLTGLEQAERVRRQTGQHRVSWFPAEGSDGG